MTSIAVLTTVFAGHGSYASASSFVAGLRPATRIGAAVVAAGAVAAMLIPHRRRQDCLEEPAPAEMLQAV